MKLCAVSTCLLQQSITGLLVSFGRLRDVRSWGVEKYGQDILYAKDKHFHCHHCLSCSIKCPWWKQEAEVYHEEKKSQGPQLLPQCPQLVSTPCFKLPIWWFGLGLLSWSGCTITWQMPSSPDLKVFLSTRCFRLSAGCYLFFNSYLLGKLTYSELRSVAIRDPRGRRSLASSWALSHLSTVPIMQVYWRGGTLPHSSHLPSLFV